MSDPFSLTLFNDDYYDVFLKAVFKKLSNVEKDGFWLYVNRGEQGDNDLEAPSQVGTYESEWAKICGQNKFRSTYHSSP